MSVGMTYKDAGVNIELGDDASQVLYEAAKLTWQNRAGQLGEVVEPFGDFSGFRAIHVGGLPEGTYMNLGFDGVGTKIEIAERIARHDTVAYDLFAMVCDDAVVRGAEPIIVGSELGVRSLGEENETYIDLVRQLAHGYIGAAREANVAVINGETAELGARVQGYSPYQGFFKRLQQGMRYAITGDMPQSSGFNYNWGAAVVWFGRKERMLTGHQIAEGNTLVGLRENGFRSNGLSLVRKIMERAYGKNWHEVLFDDEKTLADAVLYPSRIYARAVVEMFGGMYGEPQASVSGIAHITGGGIPGKLGRMLKPSGFGAVIEAPFEPPFIMQHCQDLGGVSDYEAYRTWNMGQGMIIATDEPDGVIDVAERHEIDAKMFGSITPIPEIRIVNRGVNAKTEGDLVYPLAA